MDIPKPTPPKTQQLGVKPPNVAVKKTKRHPPAPHLTHKPFANTALAQLSASLRAS